MNDIGKNTAAALNASGGAALAYRFSGPRAEATQFIADQLLQLRKTAQDCQLPFLAYLLEMSFREAFMTSVNGTLTPLDSETPAGVRAD